MRIAFVMPRQPLIGERQIHIAVFSNHLDDGTTKSVKFSGVHSDIPGAHQLDEHILR